MTYYNKCECFCGFLFFFLMMINPFWNVFTMCPILITFLGVTIFFPNDFKCKGTASGPQQMLLLPTDNGPRRNTVVMNLFALPIWSRTFHHCCVSQSLTANTEDACWNHACPGLLYSWLLCFTCISYLNCLLYCSYIDYMTSQTWVEWSAATSWLFQADTLTDFFHFPATQEWYEVTWKKHYSWLKYLGT